VSANGQARQTTVPLRAAVPLVLPGTPERAFALIQGHALSATDAPLPNALVRLRDARMGRIMTSAKTDAVGAFEFRSIDPGSYIIELIGADQSIQAASALINVNASETIATIVRLPARLDVFGLVGTTVGQAAVIAATAATAGVLAVQSTTDVSPR
jgi:hypothetical protein